MCYPTAPCSLEDILHVCLDGTEGPPRRQEYATCLVCKPLAFVHSLEKASLPIYSVDRISETGLKVPLGTTSWRKARIASWSVLGRL
jgi:hypothetical protein